jgi:hypothetical protein
MLFHVHIGAMQIDTKMPTAFYIFLNLQHYFVIANNTSEVKGG